MVVKGVDADESVYLTVEDGSLDVQEKIVAEAGLVLEAATDVILAAEVKTKNFLTASITAANGNIINAGGTVDSPILVLSAGTDIGVDKSGVASPLSLDVSELSAEAGSNIYLTNSGAVRITSNSGVSGIQGGGDLDLTTTSGDVDVASVIRMGGDVCLDLARDLDLSDDIESTGGGSIAIRTGRDVLLGDGADDTISSNGGAISIESGRSIRDQNGNDLDIDADGGLIVLTAVNDIGGTGTGEELEIAASQLAASSGGVIAITDADTDGLEIVEATTLKGGVILNGIGSVADFCLDLTGDLTVSDNILSGGDLAIRTDGNIQLGDTTGSTRGVLVAGVGADGGIGGIGGGDDVTATVTIEAGGDISDGNGDDTADGDGDGFADGANIIALGDGVINSGGRVVLSAGGNIGEVDELETDASLLAATSDGVGGLNIAEQDIVTNDGLTVTELTTAKGVATVTGLDSEGSISLDVASGDLQINEDVNSNLASTYLSAAGDIVVGNGDGDSVAATSNVILEAGGDIIDANGDNSVAVSRALTATLIAGGDIGDIDFASATGTVFEVGTPSVAAQAGGDIHLLSSGSLEATTSTYTDRSGASVTREGISAGSDVAVDVIGGDLDTGSGIVSTNGSVSLRTQTSGDIILSSQDVSASDTVSLESADEIIDDTAGLGSLVAPNVVLDAVNGIGDETGNFHLEVDTDNLAAVTRTAGSVNIEVLSGDLAVVEDLYTLRAAVEVDGIAAIEDVCVDVAAGNLNLDADITAGGNVAIRADQDVVLGEATASMSGVVLAGAGADGVIGGGDDVTATISVEAGGSIIDGNGDSALDSDGNGVVDGTNLVALGDGTTDTGGNVVLQAGGGIGSDESGASEDAIETDTLVVAASSASGDVHLLELDLVTGDGLTVGQSTTLKGLSDVVGLESAIDLSVDVAEGDLRIDEDVVGGASGVANEIALGAEGSITVGDGATDGNQVRSATSDAGNKISIRSSNGNIEDNNGSGVAALDASGGDVVLSAPNGTIGNTDFAGSATEFEINANRLAATSGDDINIVDLDIDADGLDITQLALGLGDGDVTGILATYDVCIDVVNGDLTIFENVGGLESDGSVALRTQDSDGIGEDGDILLEAYVGGEGGSATAVSIESASTINGDGTGSIAGADTVLLSDDGIGTNGSPLSVIADNFATVSSNTGDINIEIKVEGSGAVVIDELTTLKGGTTVTGVSAAKDVYVDALDGVGLQINEDVVGGTAGVASEVALRADNNIVIGDGTDGQVRNATADTGNRISLRSNNGDITDNNGIDIAAADANGGDLALSADNGTIGNTDFAGTASEFEINANRLAVSSGDDVNIVDLDSNGDGLEVTTLALAKGDGDVTGVTALNDICIDTVGALQISENVTSTSGDIALRAQAGDVTIGDGDNDVVSADGGGTISVDASGNILDNNGAGTAASATSVVLDGNSISDSGGTGAFDVNATNLAARAVDGRVDIRDVSGGVRIAELQTLKGGDTVTGLTAADEVSLDVVGGDLVIDEVVSSGSTATIRTDGSLASNATVVAADKVSVEVAGDISDGLSGEGPGQENFRGTDVVIAAGGEVGSATDELDIDSDRLSAAGRSVYLDETQGDMNISELRLENGTDPVTGIEAENEIVLSADNGTISAGLGIRAGDEVSIRTRDTLVINAPISTNSDGRVSIEVTQGGIVDRSEGISVETGTAVVRTAKDIGSPTNPIKTSVDTLSVESQRGSVYLVESDGLRIKSGELAGGGGVVSGGRAGQDFNLEVENGDLELANITAGNDVNLSVSNGDLIDCNGDESNVDAGGDVNISIPQGSFGRDGDIPEVNAEGTFSYSPQGIEPVAEDTSVSLPPGVFAQNDLDLGESSFYLDVLYPWQPIDEVILIIEDLHSYNSLSGEEKDNN